MNEEDGEEEEEEEEFGSIGRRKEREKGTKADKRKEGLREERWRRREGGDSEGVDKAMKRRERRPSGEEDENGVRGEQRMEERVGSGWL